MAEIVKVKEKEKVVDYEKKSSRKKELKNNKDKKKETKKDIPKETLWQKFMIFYNGIKSEIKKIRWTSKSDIIKYSVSTIVFILFCSIFFYGIDTIFALIQSLFK